MTHIGSSSQEGHLTHMAIKLCGKCYMYTCTCGPSMTVFFHVHVIKVHNVHVCTCLLCLLQNVLDDRLRHTNLGVVLGAVRLFLHLTDDMPNLHKDVHERIKGEFITLPSPGLGIQWSTPTLN